MKETKDQCFEFILDVQSNKNTRDEVMSLLCYVEEHFPDAVRSQFGFVRDHGSVPDWNSVSSIIDNISSTVERLHMNFRALMQDRVSKISHRYHVTPILGLGELTISLFSGYAAT